MRARAILPLLMLACVSGIAAEPGIDTVAAYAGTWSVQIDHLDTAHSKTSHETNTLKNDCWRSAPYLACRQTVDGDAKALLVFTYDAKADRYTSYPIPADGSGAGKGALEIRGNVWTFPWQVPDGATTTYYRVVNTFTTPDTIEFRQEYSTDQQSWTVMARGHEKRIAKAAVLIAAPLVSSTSGAAGR